MTEQDIVSKAFGIVTNVNKDTLGKKTVPTGVHDLYAESVSMAESISNHAVKGKYPEKLFSNRSPNETVEESKYIKSNYKQYTLPEFIDYISTITRPFGDGNWSIDYKDNEEFRKYVEYELPIYGSLEEFVKSVLPTIKSIDANGFIAVRPKEIDYKQDEQGEFVIDGSSLYKPTIYFYESKNVIDYEQGEYYLFLSKEKSHVKFANRTEKSGNIYELYTRNAVYFIKQTGVKNDNQFVIEIFYQHELNNCFVEQLKGNPNLSGDEILWQSPFIFGCDLLDCVTVNLNWLQFITNKCVFPMTVMLGSECDFNDSHGNPCTDGKILHDGNYTTCPSCKGIGHVGRLSPLGTLLIRPTTNFKDGEEKSTQAPLSYVAPDVTTLEFIQQKAENDRQKARQILHLQTSNSQVKGTENLTATGMSLDNKAMTAFVKPIIDQIFYLYDFCLKSIGVQRYGENFEAPILTYPKSYDFKSPEDYLNDLTNAISSKLPPSFVQTILIQYINAYYGDSDLTSKVFKLIVSADRIFGLSQDEINMKMAKGTVAKWEDILHSSALNLIQEAELKEPKFFDKTLESQIETIVTLAKEKESEILDNNSIYTSIVQ